MTKYGTRGTLRVKKPAESYQPESESHRIFRQMDRELELVGKWTAFLFCLLLLIAAFVWGALS